MRTLAEFSQGRDKITLMHWNEKYVIRVERGPLEQTYKLDALDFAGPEDVRARLDLAFTESCDRTFQLMGQELAALFTGERPSAV